MVFHRFDRQLFVALEGTEGTAATITPATDYIEVFDDISYTITPIEFERNHVRPSYTKIPMLKASDGITNSDVPIATVEFTFTVEMAASGAGNQTTAPRWGRLLQMCGMYEDSSVEVATVGTITSGPILHREGDGSTGRIIGTYFDGDSAVYGTGLTVGGFTGAASAATATLGTPSGSGFAYRFGTDRGYGSNTSATVQLYLPDRTNGDATGRTITARGCRATCSMTFTATDRCLMQFTVTGILHDIDDDQVAATGITYAHSTPPIFESANLVMRENTGTTNFTGACFDGLTLDFGNTVTMRPCANDASGWLAAQITDRTPTVSFNPDAIRGGTTSATVYDFWENYVVGTPETVMQWRIGRATPNQFLFRAPAVQWTGAADGDRDSFSVYDMSGNLTGGSYGDSVNNGGTATLYDDKGKDNELTIILI